MNPEESRLVTFNLDAASMTRFETQRRALYPSGSNRVPAHVMLFHKLPSDADATLRDDLARIAALQLEFAVEVGEPYSLGRGVAYRLAAPELLAIRERLAVLWNAWLIPQDRERYRPHIVVQNKVDATVARESLKTLRESFVPFAASGVGMTLYTYRNAMWYEPVTFGFARN